MLSPQRTLLLLAPAALLAFGLVTSCASSSTQGFADSTTQHVGQYPSPLPGLPRPRIGIPRVEVASKAGPASMGEAMADVLSTLAFQTQRFDVVERSQLDTLFEEQDLEGVVLEEERAEAGVVRGVDCLLIGKITDLRSKTVRKARGFGLGTLGIAALGRFGKAVDYSREDLEIVAECGVDLRLVEPSSGMVRAAHFGSFNLRDNVSAVGLEFAGFGSQAAADLQLTEDDKGKIMRLALDNAMRNMIPDVDSYLRTLAH